MEELPVESKTFPSENTFYEKKMETLEHLESLHKRRRKVRNALHSDITRMIESGSIQELFSGFSFISFVPDLLENKILSKAERVEVKTLLETIFTDLRNSDHEYAEVEALLERWIIFHEKPSE